jgi:Holliday junction resolvase
VYSYAPTLNGKGGKMPKHYKDPVQWSMINGYVTTEPKPKPRAKSKKTTNSLTAQIAHYVESCGGYAMRINVTGIYREGVGYTQSGSTVGVPDIIAIIGGLYVGIEVKTGRDQQSEAQKKVQERTRKAGGVYLIARDFDSFKAEFDAIVKGF